MQQANLFMNTISRNNLLHEIICDVKEYYLDERRKICNTLHGLKENCKIDWKLYIENNNLSSKFGVDLIILDLKIKELEASINNKDRNKNRNIIFFILFICLSK